VYGSHLCTCQYVLAYGLHLCTCWQLVWGTCAPFACACRYVSVYGCTSSVAPPCVVSVRLAPFAPALITSVRLAPLHLLVLLVYGLHLLRLLGTVLVTARAYHRSTRSYSCCEGRPMAAMHLLHILITCFSFGPMSSCTSLVFLLDPCPPSSLSPFTRAEVWRGTFISDDMGRQRLRYVAVSLLRSS
jgi:hypothetical protein